jgi:triacylglycerol esterase/lipase EstA (alpha/beta hydrolase family)
MTDQAHLVQLTIRLKFGTFTDEQRKAIVEAFRGSELGQVRIDEPIVLNLGIGGPGGLPITFDVWITILEGTAAGLLTVAITSGLKPVLKVIGNQIMRLVTTVHQDEAEAVTYIAQPEDADDALAALPADYEETLRTESRTRVWRNGRWEHEETTSRTFRVQE